MSVPRIFASPSHRNLRQWSPLACLLASFGLWACVQVQPHAGDDTDHGLGHSDHGSEQGSEAGATESPDLQPGRTQGSQAIVAAPLSTQIDAIEVAVTQPLPAVEPMEFDGLHNVFRLGENIISGGEPMHDEALDRLAKMGVRTILSVDGKAPNAAAAAERGMRYVHIPIQYSGVRDKQMLHIAKSFRELEGPFYVHCFHGMHRGPAAAAIGRIVLDGVPREEALAEMSQWCGTASKYRGLFEEIAFAKVPSAKKTAQAEFDFPSQRSFHGVRSAMIPMARHWDEVKFARKRDWQADPEHPDVVPAQEALQLAQVFERCVSMQNYDHEMPRSPEVQGWFEQGQQGAQALAQFLGNPPAQDATADRAIQWREQTLQAYRQVSASCKSCHNSYRD